MENTIIRYLRDSAEEMRAKRAKFPIGHSLYEWYDGQVVAFNHAAAYLVMKERYGAIEPDKKPWFESPIPSAIQAANASSDMCAEIKLGGGL